MVNSVGADDITHYKPSHLDLHCLQNIWFGLQVLTVNVDLVQTVQMRMLIWIYRCCIYSAKI